MKMAFVRHGELSPQVARMEGGEGLVSNLAERSIEQLKATAHLLGRIVTVKMVHSSPHPHALMSASIIAKELDALIAIDERLNEVRKDNQNTVSAKYVSERTAGFVEELRSKSTPGAIAVSHSYPIRLGIDALLGKPLVAHEDIKIDNASVTVIRHGEQGWHLDPDMINKTVY